jgi:hypothetical protein
MKASPLLSCSGCPPVQPPPPQDHQPPPRPVHRLPPPLLRPTTIEIHRLPRATADHLLGMRKGGCKEAPLKLYLAHGTFTNILTINTLDTCFAGRGTHTQRRRGLDLRQYHDHLYLHHSVCRKGPTRSEVWPAPAGAEVPSHRRSKVTRGPLEGSRCHILKFLFHNVNHVPQ